MDFGAYPPEVNSGRMYAGPGSGPMLAAAAAWDGLAFELHVAAASYGSVIAELAGLWSGPSSASMAAATLPYVTWLQTTAAQADETATRARAAAAAYEAAFAATVPPPVIEANRSLLMALVATNFFGQNTPAIAATEAQYAEMWAADAAVMYGYAGSSASATALTPFTRPPKTTSPAAAAGGAQGLPAAVNPVTAIKTINDLLTIFPIAVANLSALFNESPFLILSVPDLFPNVIIDTSTGLNTDRIVTGWAGLETFPSQGTRPPTGFPATITNPGPLAARIASAMGRAHAVGSLSVPPAWTAAAPGIRRAALTLPMLPEPGVDAPAAQAAGAVLRAGARSAFSGMALGDMAAAGMGGAAGGAAGPDGGKPPSDARLAAGAAGRPNAGGRAVAGGEAEASQHEPRTVVTGVAARIREIARLRAQGRLTDEEYAEEKQRLLGL